MAELAYATDLKSVPFGVEGSSPSARTNIIKENRAQLMASEPESIAVKTLLFVDLSLRQDRYMRRSEAASWRPKQTIHRTVSQQEEHRFLAREPRYKRFGIGPRLAKTADQVLGWCVRHAPRQASLARVGVKDAFSKMGAP